MNNPQYKKSSSKILNKIPYSWEEKRLRFLANINPRFNKHNIPDDLTVSFLPMEKIKEFGGIVKDIEKPLDEVIKGYTYFADGDIIIAKITPCFENGKGSICLDLTNKIGFGTTELHVIRCKTLNTRFLFYLMFSDLFLKWGEAEMYGAGGQKRVPESFIKDFIVTFPKIEEQKSIADFLDYKTSQIDSLIEKKENLLGFLEEKRIALITNAVTKGINPNVKIKPSGIDWLGNIPEHWNYCKTMYLGKIITGGTPATDNLEYWESGSINWLNSGEINKKNIYGVDKKITELGLLNSNARIIPAKSVLIALNGQGKTKGMAATLEVESTCSQSLAAVVPNDKISYKYLYYDLESRYSDIRGLVGEARDGLNLDHVKQIYFPIPSLEEQQKIVEYIETELVKVNSLSKKIEENIGYLKEYRTSLITSAVTGKIDIRNWQHPTKGKAHEQKDELLETAKEELK